MTMPAASERGGVPDPAEALGVSDSVLSKHISALAGGGYVASRKGDSGRRTIWVSLTKAGAGALRTHLAPLRSLLDAVEAAR